MKFSDISKEQWAELKPYLDTCLLPFTGLSGEEQPWQATEVLEKLRDALELIENPYKGRVVTYPALHYIPGLDPAEQIDAVSTKVKAAGFRYVIVLTIHTAASDWQMKHADLLIVVDTEEWTSRMQEIKSGIFEQVQALWHQQK